MVYNNNRPCITFFANHDNSTKIIIHVNTDIYKNLTASYHQPLTQVDKVKELSLIFPEDIVPADDIVSFINNCKELMKYQFIGKFSEDKKYVNLIREKLEPSWGIDDFGVINDAHFARNLSGFSVEKKIEISQ